MTLMPMPSKPTTRLPFVLPATPPVTYYVRDEYTSPRFATAFSGGCEGPVRDKIERLLPKYDFASFCTPPVWPILDQAIAEGRNWYYGDHGYFNRERCYRVSRNAVQYQPTIKTMNDMTPHRYESLGLNVRNKWETKGSRILVCPNSDIYHQRWGRSMTEWVDDVIKQLKRSTDRPIVIRTKQTSKTRSIFEDLNDAWLTVVWSSNAAVDSLRAGVPVVALAPFASTRNMGHHDLSRVETPYYPDHRIPFLWSLAHAQWTFDEMREGMAWRWLQERAQEG